MRRLFLDTAVLLYARGGEHRHRESCRSIVAACQRGDLELHVGVDAVQEFLFHRMRRVGRDTAVLETRDVRRFTVVHACDEAVIDRAIDIVATSQLRGRDAVHVATAQIAGFDAIVTPDNDFDRAPGIRRVEPADAL